jgi:hypothetical protein
VVQELADRDALGERRGVAVQVEQPLRDELKGERGHEDLRHAPDAEAVIDRQWLASPEVREAGRCVDSRARPASSDDGARNAGRDNGLQLVRDRLHRSAASVPSTREEESPRVPDSLRSTLQAGREGATADADPGGDRQRYDDGQQSDGDVQHCCENGIDRQPARGRSAGPQRHSSDVNGFHLCQRLEPAMRRSRNRRRGRALDARRRGSRW